MAADPVVPQITLRRLAPDEIFDAVYALTAYAFNPSPPLPDAEERRALLALREGVTAFALFEDETSVACALSSPLTQHARGRLLPAAGLWGVATAPAARYKGYAKRVLAALHADLRDQGFPLACLYPFRESFYERLGYATFPLAQKVRIRPSSLAPLLGAAPQGTVERLLLAEGLGPYRAFLEQIRERRHGLALFDQWSPARATRFPAWLALARVEGQVVGAMVYELAGEAVTDFTLRARHFYYLTSQGKYLLLAWLARHIDQASRVEISLAPDEAPETWLADLQLEREAAVRAPMGRVLDVAGLNGLDVAVRRESFTARVLDPNCPWNEGAWSFAAVDGQLQVRRADKADNDLAIQALSALVYGTHDPADFPARGWSGAGPETLAAMGAMFPRQHPHLHEIF